MSSRNPPKRWSTDQLIAGVEIGDWMGFLRDSDWKVDPAYLHRAAWVTGWALPSTVLARVEDARFGRELASMEIDPPPLFILGHWRSGTTHLHNLLGKDPTHTVPTSYQVMMPGHFLTSGGLLPKLTKGLLKEKRTYDNVRNGWDEAAPDEVALMKMTGMSPYLGFMFPRNAGRYEKYIDFLEATEDERRRWKQAFIYFMKKVMLANPGKRVIIKSCLHSARLRMLVDMFPNARFLVIHRNPYEVFASTLHMRSHIDWENFFQVPEGNYEDVRREQTARTGERIYRRLIEDVKLIPENRVHTISYQELAGNELEVMREVYDRLELGTWDDCEPELEDYLDSIAGYRRNRLKIDDEFQDFVWDRWRIVFDAFGYGKEYPEVTP